MWPYTQIVPWVKLFAVQYLAQCFCSLSMTRNMRPFVTHLVLLCNLIFKWNIPTDVPFRGQDIWMASRKCMSSSPEHLASLIHSYQQTIFQCFSICKYQFLWISWVNETLFLCLSVALWCDMHDAICIFINAQSSNNAVSCVVVDILKYQQQSTLYFKVKAVQ